MQTIRFSKDRRALRTCALAMGAGLLLVLGVSLAQAAERTPIDQTIDFSGDEVSIDNLSGSVKVTGWDQPSVKISGYLGEGAERLAVDAKGDSLSIRVILPDGRGYRVDGSELEIQVPRGVELEVDTVSANVDVDGLTGESIEVDTVSGRIRVDSKVRSAEIESVSGDVRLALHAAAVEVETVSGDIEVQGAEGRVELATVSGRAHVAAGNVDSANLETVSGSLRLVLAGQARGGISMEGVSADITLDLGDTPAYDLSVETFSGGIRSAVGTVVEEDFGSGRSLRHRVGEGGPRIRIESFSGTVKVQ